MTLWGYLNKLMNEQPKINRGWSDFTPTIDCGNAYLEYFIEEKSGGF